MSLPKVGVYVCVLCIIGGFFAGVIALRNFFLNQWLQSMMESRLEMGAKKIFFNQNYMYIYILLRLSLFFF